jgi:medium-chain acyl-[acyl-carrier-protein] hydrolase
LTKWLLRLPRPDAAVRLFCFPHAGGSAANYRSWASRLPRDIDVLPVQFPGRGTRIVEPVAHSWLDLIDSVRSGLAPYLSRQFAFFGHSMGALIAFDLARRLREEGVATPIHLFLSASPAPHLIPKQLVVPADDVLINELRYSAGISPDVFEHPELLELVLEAYRIDLSLLADYSYRPGRPLQCPIIALGGTMDEEVPLSCLEAWRGYTSSAFTVRMFPGGHLFVETDPSQVLDVMRDELSVI